jgi:hypothetical protein
MPHILPREQGNHGYLAIVYSRSRYSGEIPMMLVTKFWGRITGAPMSYRSHLQLVLPFNHVLGNVVNGDDSLIVLKEFK